MATPRIVPTVSGDELRVSATSFMSFRQCPERASARFRGHYGTPSLVSFVGSLSHQIFKRHLVEGAIDGDDFVAACKEEMGKSQRLGNTSVELGLKPSQLNAVFAEARDLYQRFLRLSHEGFSAAEVTFEIETAMDLVLVGQVDAIFTDDQSVRLVDWKTGALGEAEGQLMFYALLWVLEHEQLPTSVEAVSIGTGERFSATPTSEDIEEVGFEIGAMVDELRTAWATGGELERRGGPWCEYCPILADCPEGGATMALLSGSGSKRDADVGEGRRLAPAPPPDPAF